MVFMQAGRGDAQNAALQNTWQGYVTDTHCGTNCQVTKDMTPDKKCADRCVRKGSKYGMGVDSHVYVLEPQNKAARHAATDVSVTGTSMARLSTSTPSRRKNGCKLKTKEL